MKNTIIGILLLATIVTGYLAAKSMLRISLEGIEGRTAKLIRGDLTLPINATGEVKPARRVEIKAEASGEVIEIHKQAGSRVQVGDLIIRLQPDEEERIVSRARLDLEIAEARLTTARITLEQARTADMVAAQSRLKQLEESFRFQKFRLKKLAELPTELRNEEEMLQRETIYLSQQAQVESARADLHRARFAISRAEQDLKQADAAHKAAKDNLADALKRLTKTEIISPMDGIIGDIRTQVGSVIQGGKTTLTGGSVLAVVLDVDKLIVKAEVDESDIGRILEIAPAWAKPGNDGSVVMPEDPAVAAEAIEHRPTITVESFREQEFQGVIERIYPEPRILSGVVTYVVDVVITSDNRRLLLPGMRADVRFTSEHVEDALLCPNEAIREGPKGQLGVYIPKPGAPPTERQTEFVPCRFGLDNGIYSEVLCEALTEGLKVYTKLPAKQDRERDKKRRRSKS